MKKIVLLLQILICIDVYSFEIEGNYSGNWIYIPDGEENYVGSKISFSFTDNDYYMYLWGKEHEETGEWNISEKDNIQYLNLSRNLGTTFKEKFGVLYSPRRLFLYENDVLFFKSDDGLKLDGFEPRILSVKTSSFLKEGSTNYDGLSYLNSFIKKSVPWVEGTDGYGIGEWIELEIQTYAYPMNSFLLSNGYVSFEKPYLFYLNSRVKKLRVTSDDGRIDFVTSLDDSANFQKIELPEEIKMSIVKLRFTIEEVYPGSKWDDTCLNLIVPLNKIP